MTKITQQHAENLYTTARLIAIGKGNPAFVKRMLLVFVQQMKDTIHELNNYLHNPDQIFTILHQAKPSVSEICNPSMIELIEGIEKLAKLHHTGEMISEVQVFIVRIQEVILAISQVELSEDK